MQPGAAAPAGPRGTAGAHARGADPAADQLRLGRIIGSALRQSDEALAATVSSRLDEEAKARLWTLIETADDGPADQAGNAAAGPRGSDGADRWGMVPLLDMLTETALRTGCLDAFSPVGTRSDLPAAVLFQRLLLAVYAYGTNTGIRAVAAADHGHGEDELRYIRRRYMTVESCRQAARVIANATFTARQAWLWGEGSTAVASDSTHFRAWDQNIFTEWHSRYRRGKRSVLIYWTVEEKGSMAVHSQLLSCSASEVHAMVEGAMATART